MAESVIKSFFPSQVASDQEKVSEEYGLKVGRAIEREWFSSGSGQDRYSTYKNDFHRLRLYARGEQSIQKYKDELSINGDLSYLNLDWKPVPIIPKFVDIVVNGISERAFDIKCYSQDPYGVSKRTKYMESIIRDMQTKEMNNFVKQKFGIDMFENPVEELPDSKEELEIHMQMSYKQQVELAEEQALNTLMDGNNYGLTKKRFYYDITVIGIGAIKNNFSTSEGVTVDYVDPANLVWSYTDNPYFDDIYYVGEVKEVPVNELKKQFPELTDQDLKLNTGGRGRSERGDTNTRQLLYFNYKTYMNEVYKVKELATGASKIIVRDDQFDPPVEVMEGQYGKMSRSIEVLYEGVMIVGSNKILKWEMAKNMMRPKSDNSKVLMNYSIVAPRMYQGKIESLVSRITSFADMVQLTHLKLQQVLARTVPDGVYLNADGLAEIDLGNGTNYNPQEALNMFFQTGSVIGRSFTQEGDMNPGKIPIQEINSGSGGNKMQALIQAYNYYLQMIRDATGLNEARDGSTPDSRALVGVQKLAAANSNTATRHILDAGLFLTGQLCESLSLRISDILEYSPSKEAFIQKIGGHNVATLKEMSDLHLYDFGIFLELQPDDEQKQILEQNIVTALSAQMIELSDAIDIREVRNIKLANQVLKMRRAKKLAKDQKMQQENMQAQADANIKATDAASKATADKLQQELAGKKELLEIEGNIDLQKMTAEVQAKKDLMKLEFDYNMQLHSATEKINKEKESVKEDRKDGRTKIQASQQSKMIKQRQENSEPTEFESSGNDIMGGGFGLNSFDPR